GTGGSPALQRPVVDAQNIIPIPVPRPPTNQTFRRGNTVRSHSGKGATCNEAEDGDQDLAGFGVPTRSSQLVVLITKHRIQLRVVLTRIVGFEHSLNI